jgi:hypothetical protein
MITATVQEVRLSLLVGRSASHAQCDPATGPDKSDIASACAVKAIYNRRSRHSAIDMLSPVDHEERYWDRRAAA